MFVSKYQCLVSFLIGTSKMLEGRCEYALFFTSKNNKSIFFFLRLRNKSAVASQVVPVVHECLGILARATLFPISNA